MRSLIVRTALLAMAYAFVAPVAGAVPPRPNIVLIISDDQAWTDYGFMGHEVIRTPALDKLASESAVFTRGYVPTSLCRPSLATIVTGLYAHQHGVTGNDPAQRQQGPAAWQAANQKLISGGVGSHPTLPRELAKLGYVSHQSGKWWEGSYTKGGFTEGMTHGDMSRGGRHGDEGLKIGREGMQPVTDFIDQAVSEGKPFFVWYAPLLPHDPHHPPKRLLEKYRTAGRDPGLARYFAMCEWFDETCGQLLDHLDKQGLKENTIVLYVCDNGWVANASARQQPAGWNQPFASRSKRSPQDGGIRTPIMIRWLGRVRPGKRDALASSIDLMPTVLSAVDLQPTSEMAGVDLVALAGEEAPHRQNLYGAIFRHDIPDLDNPASGLSFRWIIDGEWKLIVPVDDLADYTPERWNPEDHAPQLYHITTDPHEQQNLAGKQPEKVKELTEKLNAWWQGK